jgi:low affinity Fe/Cu permease
MGKPKSGSRSHTHAQDTTDLFTRFTTRTSTLLGRPWTFSIAFVTLAVWAVSGPILGFSEAWQLVINTATTVVTFLMVFIIQNTQNRDNIALNIKLDALLRKHGITEKSLVEAEDRSDKELEQSKAHMQTRTSASNRAKRGT